MDFLKRNRVGLILRAYAPKPNLVEKTVNQVIEVARRLYPLEIQGCRVFSRMDVMIASDRRCVDFDCGLTADALRQKDEVILFQVTEVKEGDLYCGLLNAGFYNQIRDGIDYTMNLSHGVLSYITPENMGAMLQALERGARVTGLALNEFAESILEGRILDTCDIWHCESWMRVGGYDIRGAQPRPNDRSWGWVRDMPDGEEKDWSYTTAGVEEMIPLINLVRLFGPCIAPVRPLGGGTWVIPDDPEIRAREEKKLRTKYDRQVRAAALEGVNLSFLKHGVMPEYRNEK